MRQPHFKTSGQSEQTLWRLSLLFLNIAFGHKWVHFTECILGNIPQLYDESQDGKVRALFKEEAT